MIKEFGIDPELFKDKNVCDLLHNQFGVSTGRLVAAFPTRRNWWQMAKRNVQSAELSNEQKRNMYLLIESFSKNRSFFATEFRDWDDERHWINQALYLHKNGQPFDLIISDYDETECVKLSALTFNKEWDVKRGTKVQRKAKPLCEILRPLLVHSKKIIFVDSYFKPWHNDFERTQDVNGRYFSTYENSLRPLEAFCKTVYKQTKHDISKIKFEVYVGGTRGEPFEFMKNKFNEYKNILEHKLPPIKVNFFFKTSIHARLLLTELGGIKVDYGFSEHKPNNEPETLVNLLEDVQYDDVIKKYDGGERGLSELILTVHGTHQ